MTIRTIPPNFAAICWLKHMQQPLAICPSSSVRSGNIYGEGDLHWDRLIPGTIRSALFGKPPLIRSNGLLKRDYIYAGDIIRAYLKTLVSGLAGKSPCRYSHQFWSEAFAHRVGRGAKHPVWVESK
jgi:nucleoside-diphosphate-sugar epimerase